MNCARRVFSEVAGLSLLVWAVSLTGQEAGPMPGHSSHGEEFNEGPRQKAYLMKSTGAVNFPVTTSNKEAQAYFNQGVGQLHGFWYFEAERSFRQVAVLDPNCAMAYWGMSMANTRNSTRAKQLIANAVERKASASKREQLWIESLAEYYADLKAPDKDRVSALLKRYTEMSKEFPDDIEIKAFLALETWENASKVPLKDYDAVNNLIEDVFKVQPMHPAHHYRIHLWDAKKASNALASAALCGQTSTSIAHMWHMPGHIFSKLQRYSDAAWQQEASARVDHAHMMRDRVLPDQIHNYAHNNEWLTRDLVFVGRVHDAVDLAQNMIELPRLAPKPKTAAAEAKASDDKESESSDSEGGRRESGSTSPRNSYTYGRTRLLETLVRFELWPDILSLSKTMYLTPNEDQEERVKIMHAVGLANFNSGKAAEGEKVIAELDEWLQRELKAAPESSSKSSGTGGKIIIPSKSESGGTNRVSAAKGAPRTKAGQALEPAVSELKALSALAKGDTTAAKDHLSKAKNVQKERLARTYLALGDKAKAEQLAREAANSAKKQVQPLANYVDILYRCDKAEQAYTNFNQLREMSAEIDLDVPVFKRLAPVAKDLKLPTNWRISASTPADSGVRPALSKLGPFRWQPSPAQDWSLTDSNGKRVSLRNYRGKPVVVMFYLGFGCSHCIQQLNAFAPMTAKFAEAGISLVAVSTDTAEGLKKTFAKSDSEKGFPFPLVSDASLKTFKAYRAFDDFENIPLHGIFLVDGNGLVRWQDISYEPFMQVNFLLSEAQRLLAIPKTALISSKE